MTYNSLAYKRQKIETPMCRKIFYLALFDESVDHLSLDQPESEKILLRSVRTLAGSLYLPNVEQVGSHARG